MLFRSTTNLIDHQLILQHHMLPRVLLNKVRETLLIQFLYQPILYTLQRTHAHLVLYLIRKIAYKLTPPQTEPRRFIMTKQRKLPAINKETVFTVPVFLSPKHLVTRHLDLFLTRIDLHFLLLRHLIYELISIDELAVQAFA